MIFSNKQKKYITDKNGVATSRWTREDNHSSSVTRNIPKPLVGIPKSSHVREKHSEENRLKRAEFLQVFKDTVKPVPATEEARNLWLAVYLHQMGNVTPVKERSTLSRLETPTVDADIRYPEGYGSAAFYGLIIADATPSIDTEPYNERSNWEYGHGQLYQLSIRDGYLVAGTNVDKVQATREELRAARAIQKSSLIDTARDFYARLGIRDDIDHVFNAHDIARAEETAEKSNRGAYESSGYKRYDSDRGRTTRESDDYEEVSSLDRAIRDPLGITDPGGVRDPLAAILRDSLFGDHGF